MMSDRIDFASNGHVDTEVQASAGKSEGRAKGKAPAKGPGKPKAPRKPARPTQGRDRKARSQVMAWAHRYTGAAIVLSAGLNALAACRHSAGEGLLTQGAAGVVSGVIPVLVCGLAQLAGWLVRSRQRRLAYAAGGVGVGMLLLSVLHVSEAIALLTGQHMVLAGLLAVGIDCGLVVSELAAIMVAEGE
jgi:FtsH-binding integral membrane protein